MSKICKVTVSGLPPDVCEMVIEFSDDLVSRYPESALENSAKAFSEQATVRRWQKENSDRSEEPKFVQSFSVEPLTDLDVDSVPPSRIGPYLHVRGKDRFLK